MLNPSAPYNQKRRRVMSRKQLMALKPTKEDITNEMKEFLRNPWVSKKMQRALLIVVDLVLPVRHGK
jgi:hypothetical protein